MSKPKTHKLYGTEYLGRLKTACWWYFEQTDRCVVTTDWKFVTCKRCLRNKP